MRRSAQTQDIVLSATAAATSVGHVGSAAPDFMIGIASQVMIDVPIASHVTPPSTTVFPATDGHVGSVLPDVAAPDCTASKMKFDTAAGVSRFHEMRSALPARALLEPVSYLQATRQPLALAGALPVTVTRLYPVRLEAVELSVSLMKLSLPSYQRSAK